MVHTIRSKNFGSYGAQGVGAIAQLVVGLSPDEVDEERLCQGILNSGRYLLYPGKSTEWDQTPDAYPADYIKTNNGGQTTAFIVGCIAFRDQFNCRYYVHFAYRLVDNRFANNIFYYFKPAPNIVINDRFALAGSRMESPPCPDQDD